MKVREVVYMILDELKNSSDDRNFEEEHVIYLINKYRAFILKQRYGTDIKKIIPESNYQTICIDLTPAKPDPSTCYSGPGLSSTDTIPFFMSFGSKRLFSTLDFTNIYFTLVNRDRFNFVSVRSWLQNIIYATIGPDNHLYLKSGNNQYQHLTKAKINAIFEDFLEASELECYTIEDLQDAPENCSIPDILDRTFPLESALIPPLIELVLKELVPAIYKPEDTQNNAADDLSKVNMKQ